MKVSMDKPIITRIRLDFIITRYAITTEKVKLVVC